MYGAVRFWWKASAGHRLRPWKSPYLRWRVETFTGIPAETLRLRDFVGAWGCGSGGRWGASSAG